MLWHFLAKCYVMKHHIFTLNLLLKSVFSLIALPLSVFCSEAQDLQPVSYNPNINVAQNVRYLGSDRSLAPEINLMNTFPNPVINEATLVFNSSQDNLNYEIRIINNSGIRLRIINGTTMKGQNTVNFQVGDLAPGIYYAELVAPGNQQTLKFLK
jgi:Secretion system C-terminal sorting domain